MKLDSYENNSYQRCNRCVMDTDASDITFDESGLCSYCIEFLERSGDVINEAPLEKEAHLNTFVEKVKKAGKGKEYDCIVGVSGGVDSSWTLVEVKRLGLRPLAVHMDNGWNSELAQNNIANLVQKLDVDLYTHVIEWGEYRALMQAFFDADVIDVELLYDNAMLAVNYQLANKYGLKYILSGSNQVTEGMRMPPTWNWFKYDKKNITAIAKKGGMQGLKTFPSIGVVDRVRNNYIKKIKWVPFLDYLPFNKESSLDVLEKEYNYKRYPYKHYESIFTRFYQGYILPEKFKVDKRKIHFATMVVAGQMNREEGLRSLEGIAYPSQQDLDIDAKYFLKKMGWNSKELANYLARPEIPHTAYPSEKWVWDGMLKINKKIKSFLKK